VEPAVWRAARADLHLLLARAFLPPVKREFAWAFTRDLPDDLGEATACLPFDCSAGVAALRESVVGLRHRELLQAYSALFLQPPRRASLEAAVHLDGSAMGPATFAVAERYAAHGLCAAEGLHEPADHLARMLEFSGYLMERAATAHDEDEAAALEGEARDFLAAFVCPWIPALSVEIRAACGELALPRAYQHLAELAAIAAWEGEGWRREGNPGARARAPRMAACVQCEKPYAEDAALRAVRRIMKKKGLPIAHLDRCENCRGITDESPGALEPAELRAL
jgi:TorA maturation chaperone TorD